MNLLEVYKDSHPYTDKPIRVPHNFISTVVIVRVSSIGAQRSWRRAGWMTPVIDAPMEFQGISRRVYLATKALRFESLGLPFQLDFGFVGWLPDAFLQVWEPDPPIHSEAQLPAIQEKLDELEQNQRRTITFSLLDVEYYPSESPSLVVSEFLLDVGYQTYEVGRFFRASDGVVVGDPVIDASPGLLVATFTSSKRLEPGAIKVKIVVQGVPNGS